MGIRYVKRPNYGDENLYSPFNKEVAFLNSCVRKYLKKEMTWKINQI